MFEIKKVSTVLLSLFVLILFVDPSGLMLGLKELSLLFIFCLYFVYVLVVKRGFVDTNSLVYSGVILTFPVLSLILSKIVGNQIIFSEWLHFYKSHLVILFLLPVVVFDVDLKKTFNISALLVAIVTIVFYMISVYYGDNFKVIYEVVVKKYQNGMYSYRSFLGHTILSLFYKTSPLLLLVFPIYFYRFLFSKGKIFWNLVASGLLLLGLLITGTRAPMLAAVLLFMIILGQYVFFKLSRLLAIIIMVSVLLSSFLILRALVLEKNEYSNQIKYSNIDSYKKSFSSTKTLIFGEGVGSEIWFSGSKQLRSYTELTYFDIIRMYGLIMGLFLIFWFLIPLYYLFNSADNENKMLGYGYLFYLLVAGTNPLLLSSTGMLALCYVSSKGLRWNK